MVFRGGQKAGRLSQLRSPIPCVAIRHHRLLPLLLFTERVSSSFSTFPGSFRIVAGHQSSYNLPTGRRHYAERVVSRPKAHTGRTTAAPRKKAPVVVQTKPAARKSTGGSAKTKPKPKATPKKVTGSKVRGRARTKSKAKSKSKPKPKRKAKAKAKPKPKKKVLTDEQKATAKAKLAVQKQKRRIAELKRIALPAPSSYPLNVWSLVVKQTCEDRDASERGDFGSTSKVASMRYRELTPDGREQLNHVIGQQNAAIKAAYRKFIESYTPKEIYAANHARRILTRQGYRKFPVLRDERQVKGVLTAYGFFLKERSTSGDFAGIKTGASFQLIAKEWRTLPAPNKKKYEDLALQDHVRYVEERKSVLGRDVRSKNLATS